MAELVARLDSSRYAVRQQAVERLEALVGRPELGPVLAADGTKEAVPGLLEALEKNRFLAPTSESPYRLPWLAGLSIARRDPWPEADAWLAGLMGRDEPLVVGRPAGPELSATAAAVFLARRNRDPSQFGLQAMPEPVVSGFGIPGHRFLSPDSRKQVQAWWERQREKAKTP